MKSIILCMVLVSNFGFTTESPKTDKSSGATPTPKIAEKSEKEVAGKNAEGEKLFTTNCSACHGTDGKGETPAGKAVKARNLVSTDLKEFKQLADKSKKTIVQSDILLTLKQGVPGTPMAPFAHIPEADRKKIADYVLYLRKTSK